MFSHVSVCPHGACNAREGVCVAGDGDMCGGEGACMAWGWEVGCPWLKECMAEGVCT